MEDRQQLVVSVGAQQVTVASAKRRVPDAGLIRALAKEHSWVRGLVRVEGDLRHVCYFKVGPKGKQIKQLKSWRVRQIEEGGELDG